MSSGIGTGLSFGFQPTGSGGGGSGSVTSVGLSMPVAFSVTNSPITSSGTLVVSANGVASQYIRGDGQLANFPTNTGGGSSVNYYLNGSVSQGSILGNTYYQMSSVANTGSAVNFGLTGASPSVYFLTDIGNPDELEVPTGSWIFRTYLSASTNIGTATIQARLYKYDGANFTLINTGNDESITNGTNIDLYTYALTIPSGTTLLATDRLAIVLTAGNLGGKTLTLYTQDSKLAQIQTTYSTGLTALNGLTDSVQYFAVGTSGTDFAISSSGDTHTFNLPTASASNRGALSSADWTTFNNKVGVSGTTTANYVSKFSASGTITNSQIQDDGTNIGINSAPVVGIKVRISSTEGAGLSVIESKSGNFNPIAITGTSNGVTTNSSGNKGVQGNASGNTQLNIGVSSQASGSSAKNIGLQGIASGGTNNYGARLIDGTEGLDKFLKSVTANGETNWAYITTSDITGLPTNLSSFVGNTLPMTYGVPDTEGYFSLSSATASAVTYFRVWSNDTTFYTNWLSQAVVGSFLELNQSATIYGLYNITSITYDAGNSWYTFGVTYIYGSGTFTLDSFSNVSFSKQNMTIKDEGSSLSTKVNSINFTGSGVTASISGDEVTVDIASASLNLGLVYPITTYTYLT